MGIDIPALRGWREVLRDELSVQPRLARQQDVAEFLHVSQSTVSRGHLTKEDVARLDRELGSDGRLIAAWSNERYRLQHPVTPDFFQREIDWLVQEATSDRAIDVARSAGALAQHFEGLLHHVGRSSRAAVERLAAGAQLTQAWAMLNYLPASEQTFVVEHAKRVIANYRSEGLTVFASWLSFDAERLRTGEVNADLDALERLAPEAASLAPLHASLFHEELAKQMILSPGHDLRDVQRAVRAGREAADRDRRLLLAAPRFDDIWARAVWKKGHDPRAGAEILDKAIADLALGGDDVSVIGVRARSFRGLMQLDDGDLEGATQTLVEAYELADRIQMGYFRDRVRTVLEELGVLRRR